MRQCVGACPRRLPARRRQRQGLLPPRTSSSHPFWHRLKPAFRALAAVNLEPRALPAKDQAPPPPAGPPRLLSSRTFLRSPTFFIDISRHGAPSTRRTPSRRPSRRHEPDRARLAVQHRRGVEGAQAPRGQEPLCRHGRRVRRDVLVHDLRARRHQVRRPSSSSSCLVLARELFVDTLLTYSVANVPATSITGGTQAGQDGTAASTPNTSNRASPSPPFSSTPRDPTLTPRLPPSHSPLHRSLLRLLPRCLRLDLLPVRRSSARSSPRRSAQVADAFLPRSVSGGLFNPAVSLGMFLVGVLTPMRAVLLTISQILGGITGSAIIQALLPGTLNVRTTLIPGMSVRSTFSPCELSRGRCADSRSSSPPCRSCEGSSSRCS